MSSNFSLSYHVDIVMCIDATGSMGGLIHKVKENASHLHSDLFQLMKKKGKNIDELRTRIIVFRDYDADGVENAMLATDFYRLPEENAEFQAALDCIEAKGGGDDPEDGLEALAYAMKSDWAKEGQKKRQIIVVWSDEGTHPLGVGPKVAMEGYPSKMPRDFDQLTQMWDDDEIMNYSAKRLLLFAPESSGWNEISSTWDQVIHFPSEAGNGLDEINYEAILSEITNTI